MANKDLPWKQMTQETPEAQFDVRLIEKKIAEKFITPEEAQAFQKNLPEETDFDFSTPESLEAQEEDVQP